MKFQVPIVRISHQFGSIEVEANTQEEANSRALEEAGNHTYSEKSAEYELEENLSNKARDEQVVAEALQGALTMISDMASGFSENEFHQTPEQQISDIKGAMMILGVEPQE